MAWEQVKGEREVRGKVICGEEKVMIVFHEKLGLAALTAQIKTELNIQATPQPTTRKQKLDCRRVMISSLDKCL